MIMCISGMPHIYNCFLTLFWLCVFLQIVQECHFGVLLLHLFNTYTIVSQELLLLASRLTSSTVMHALTNCLTDFWLMCV